MIVAVIVWICLQMGGSDKNLEVVKLTGSLAKLMVVNVMSV